MLYKTHNYPIQNIKYHYCSASNLNCWIISASEKIKKIIKRQANHIKKNVFVFYRKNSANRVQERNKEKI